MKTNINRKLRYIIKDYLNGLPVYKICEKHDCSEWQVRYYTSKNKIQKRPKGFHRAKPVKMQNLITGRIIKAESVSQFCRVAELPENSKFHFVDVFNGLKEHHRNWVPLEY